MVNNMKTKKVIVYCSCCGCRLKEQKAHLDITGEYYCTSCYRNLLQAKYPEHNVKKIYKLSKPERKYRRKCRRR